MPSLAPARTRPDRGRATLSRYTYAAVGVVVAGSRSSSPR